MDYIIGLMYVMAVGCGLAAVLLVAEAIYTQWHRSILLRWGILLLVVAGVLMWVMVS